MLVAKTLTPGQQGANNPQGGGFPIFFMSSFPFKRLHAKGVGGISNRWFATILPGRPTDLGARSQVDKPITQLIKTLFFRFMEEEGWIDILDTPCVWGPANYRRIWLEQPQLISFSGLA